MDLKIFSIYDAKAKVFMSPMVLMNVETAIRGFKYEVNKGQSDVARQPEDFTLFEIGRYSDGTGEIVGSDPSVVINGIQLKEEEEEFDSTEEMREVAKEMSTIRELVATRLGNLEQHIIGLKAQPKKRGWFR